MNPLRLRQRAAITLALRQWFEEHGYLEVHTPNLVACPALEEHLEPVHVGDRYLHTSPEFAMKRVLATGLCRIYQICPSYREDEVGVHHTREFTMIEWYRVGAGTPEMMDETISLIATAARAVGFPVPQFERSTVKALRHQAGLNETEDEIEWFREWVDLIEPTLTRPTIVYDYPIWQAAMAARRDDVADRFEVYLSGIEIANCFAEEGDARELLHRFETSANKRTRQGKSPHPTDEALLQQTNKMPRTAGIAMGLDRLVMALTEAQHIREVQVQ